MLSIFQYLETRPAKEVFQLLTALGQACAPQFQAIQDNMKQEAPEAPEDTVQ